MVSEVSVVDDEFLRRVSQSNLPAGNTETPSFNPEYPNVEQQEDFTSRPSHELVAAAPDHDGTAANMSSASDVANLTQPTLIVRGGDSMRVRLALDSSRSSWTVGSAADRDLSIEHDGVDANHAILLREGSIWTLCDRQSTNGSYVNGERIDSANIVSGDVLRLGSVDCLFVCPTDNILSATPTPPVTGAILDNLNADYDQQTAVFDMALDDVEAPPFRARHTDDHLPVGGRLSARNKHKTGLLQRLGLDPRIILTLCLATTLVMAIIALLLLM
jgi:hypothetical protein